MNLLDLAKSRYSCRNYQPTSVEQEKLDYTTCWVCNFDADKCKQLFAIADNEEPAVLIPIGYPADELKEKKRKAVEEIVK